MTISSLLRNARLLYRAAECYRKAARCIPSRDSAMIEQLYKRAEECQTRAVSLCDQAESQRFLKQPRIFSHAPRVHAKRGKA